MPSLKISPSWLTLSIRTFGLHLFFLLCLSGGIKLISFFTDMQNVLPVANQPEVKSAITTKNKGVTKTKTHYGYKPETFGKYKKPENLDIPEDIDLVGPKIQNNLCRVFELLKNFVIVIFCVLLDLFTGTSKCLLLRCSFEKFCSCNLMLVESCRKDYAEGFKLRTFWNSCF